MNQERGKESAEGFKANYAGSKAASRMVRHPSTQCGFKGDRRPQWSQEGKFGEQKGKGLSRWRIQSWPEAGAGTHLAQTGAVSLDFFQVPFVQALSSCNWKCAAPVRQSPEPCSSPVTFPKTFWGWNNSRSASWSGGDLGQAPGF